MKKIKSKWYLLICFSAFLFSYLMLFSSLKDLEYYSDKVTIFDYDKNISNSLDNKKDFQAVYWSERPNRKIEHSQFNKSVQTTVILAEGNINILFNNTLNNHFSSNEAIISEQLSIELFGSKKNKGNTFLFEGNHYTINSILPLSTEKLLIVKPKFDEAKYDRYTFEYNPKIDIYSEEIQKKSIDYDASTDFMFLIIILKFFILLNLLYFLLVFVDSLLIEKTSKLFKLLLIICWCLFSLKFMLLPKEYQPNEWSNIAFYINLIKDKITNLNVWLRIPKSFFEYNFFKKYLISFVYNYILYRLVYYFHLRKNFKK